MNDDIRLAFSHPVDRAAAMDTRGVRDRISLRDYVVEVEIGAFQQERGARQRVRFNIVVDVVSPTGTPSDDVDRILSYDLIIDAIDAELSEARLNLLETLAERVADHILGDPKAARVFVRIEKLDRVAGALGVEIVRDAAPVRAAPQETAVPVVVYLGNGVLTGPLLPQWLDRLAALSEPVILCVGAPDTPPAPLSDAPLAQRRIALLSIEQNAWVLAGRDPRCIVVDSRTEMDWAMKHRQMTVWAPSKLVLDATDRPRPDGQDAVSLAMWLAQQLGAARFVCIGADLPVRREVPSRGLDAADLGQRI